MRTKAQVKANRHVPAAALALTLTAFGTAAPLGDDTTSDRLEQMQREIERLREDNQAMRGEIDELRVQTGDNWLTEKRATEIRAIVHEVLSDADTRASLLADGLMAGWSDGFFLADANGRFRLEVQGHLQFRWMYNYHGDHTPSPAAAVAFAPADTDRHRSGFEMARTRLTFRGHVFSPDITYLVRGDFSRHGISPVPTALDSTDRFGGGFHLLDAWMRFHLSDEWSIRAGQFKLPFTREQLVSGAHQLAVERSVIDDRLNIGRSQGVDITWVSGPHRVTGAVSDGGTSSIGGSVPFVGGGAGTTAGLGAVSHDVEYAFTARYEHLIAGEWRQFEDITSPPGDEFGLLVGAALHYQRGEAGPAVPGLAATTSHKWLGFTIDASAEWGGATAMLAFTYHRFDERFVGSRHDTWGVVLQGGFYVAPKWEVFGRYEYGDWNMRRRPSPPAAPTIFDNLEEDTHLITVGVNYYLDGHDLKWTTDLGVSLSRVTHAWGWNPAGRTGWRAASDDDPLQIVFRTQLQLLF